MGEFDDVDANRFCKMEAGTWFDVEASIPETQDVWGEWPWGIAPACYSFSRIRQCLRWLVCLVAFGLIDVPNPSSIGRQRHSKSGQSSDWPMLTRSMQDVGPSSMQKTMDPSP